MNTNNNLDIAPGLYFDRGSNMEIGFSGRILLCVKINGSRVYFHEYNPKPNLMAEILESDPEFCSLKSVNFVRKTVGEMNVIRELDENFRQDMISSKKHIIAKYQSLISELGHA